MSTDEYQLLTTVKTLDEAVEITKQHGLSKYRTSNLAHYTKYSYKCSEYRKYSFCRYEIQVYIHDNDPTTIKLTYKNAHYHDQRNVTNRLPSPVRDSAKKYVKCHLTQSQIKNALSMDYPNKSYN